MSLRALLFFAFPFSFKFESLPINQMKKIGKIFAKKGKRVQKLKKKDEVKEKKWAKVQVGAPGSYMQRYVRIEQPGESQ